MAGRDNGMDIALRSEEVQDILNKPPQWMIRWGNSLLMLLIALFFALSYFIKYPDVVEGTAVISTDVPPVLVQSNISGRIAHLYFDDGQQVRQGDVLAEIINPVPSESIDSLQRLLDAVGRFLREPSMSHFSGLKVPKLFESSADAQQLFNSIEAYHDFIFNPDTQLRLNDLEIRLEANKQLMLLAHEEAKLNKVILKNALERYDMQKREYEMGYTTKLEYLNAQSGYNESLKAEQADKKNELRIELIIQDLRTQVHSFTIEQENEKTILRNRIEEQRTKLENYIVRWRNDFAIKSPVSGKISIIGRLKTRQLVDKGSPLFAVIPPHERYETMMEIPLQGSGKVKTGQKVKLKIANYPFQEFGFVSATISQIASLPKESVYQLTLSLDSGLVSSYGRPLAYTPEMEAVAEVITEDLRLIERLFQSVRSIVR